MDISGRVDGKRRKVNKIITAFGRDELDQYVNKAIDDKRMLFADKKRSHNVVGETEQQLLSGRNYDFTDNVQHFLESFNYKKGITKLPESSGGGVSMADAFKNAKPLKKRNSIDTEYFDAINSGDMDQARQMVEQAAQMTFPNSFMIRNGEFKTSWHSQNTDSDSFHLNDPPKMVYRSTVGIFIKDARGKK